MQTRFRWPLLTLLAAVLLFSAALVNRFSQPPTLTPTPTPAQSVQGTPSPANLGIVGMVIPTSTPAIIVPSATPSGRPVVTYREALVGQVRRLNPLYAPANRADADITALIYEGLLRYDERGAPIPNLAAEMPTISNDGLEYVVRLREDVLWQDGTPFTAADVLYTMSIVRDPAFDGPAWLRALWRTVETEQLTPTIIRFRLTQPLGGFTAALTLGLLPEHALRGTAAAQLAAHPFNLSPIGTGPYQLEALRSENGVIRQVDVRVSPAYRTRPEGQGGYAVDRLRFQLFDSFEAALTALNNGAVDGLAARTPDDRGALAGVANVSLKTALAPIVGTLVFNWDRASAPFLRQRGVRAALQVGLNRQGIVTAQMNNLATLANSPLLLGTWAYQPNLPWPPFNPDQARADMAAAAARLARGDTSDTADPATPDPSIPTPIPSTILFSFSILVDDYPARVAVAREVAAQWSQYNITVNVDVVDGATFQTRVQNHDFDVVLLELGLDTSADPDVYAYWHQGQYPDGANYGGANDRVTSQLLERARRESVGVNRAVLYQAFQSEFIARAVAIPMYYPLYTYATTTRLNGAQLGLMTTPSDRFRNIRDWTLGG
jgi:peptide/nickel transport system substrate-binding protein